MLKIKMCGRLYVQFEWDWPYPPIPAFLWRNCSYTHMSSATVQTLRWGNFLRVSLVDTNGSYSGRMDYTFGKSTLLVYNEEELSEAVVVRKSSFSGLLLDSFLAVKGQRRGMFVCCETHDDAVQVWDEVPL